MTREGFRELCENRIVFLDGATGTNLMKAGLTGGVCPEDWIRKNPEVIVRLQEEYVVAGTDILYAPTFTANRTKLSEYGLEKELIEINREMVRLSRKAAGGKALVAGDLTMTGVSLKPLGDCEFETLVDIYKEQVDAILQEGVDLFVIETMMSLAESRAALIAIREICDLPVMVTLTYNDDGRSLYGTPPDAAVVTLQSLGADAVGLNCSTGPSDMVPLVEKMRRVSRVPIIAKPNAGLPELINGESVYQMGPEDFAAEMELLADAGASILGGCCGTTPGHIKSLHDRLFQHEVKRPAPEVKRVIASERGVQEIDPDGAFIIVGERINPTGKKALAAELREGKMDIVKNFAREQEEKGASILDVNMGTSGIDEKETMLRAIEEVTFTVDLPLSIDTSYPEVMEAALRQYPGRALMNSISAEEPKMRTMLRIAKKYGAMFILLPLSESGLPKSMEEKHANIDKILEAAREEGLSEDDVIVDLLVATAGAEPDAAQKCFATLDHCRQRGLPTICGLSNISFGLPQRPFVNTAFLSVAISRGLTMAIANPSQDLLIYTALATDMLMQRPGASDRYIALPEADLSGGAGTKKKSTTSDKPSDEDMDPLFKCVVRGDSDNIKNETQVKLDAGKTPKMILDEFLIPGINEVGRLYDEKLYFLPQLIAGAGAMEAAVSVLEPLMEEAGSEKKETVVIATVEGDIHDIGKNLVALMLKNYGYNVIDLGKDVPAEVIVDTALAENASVIGLSALMTTTMVHMKTVVELAKEKGCKARIVVGGACITQEYSDEIGADGYSEDASECVKLVQKLLNIE